MTETTKKYVEASGGEMLSNIEKIQAVRHSNLGISMYMFWAAGAFAGISVSCPIIYIVY